MSLGGKITDSMGDASIDNQDEDRFACDGCGQKHLCREVWAEPNRGPLSAAGVLVGSMLVFLLPILAAIIAAAVAGNYTDAGTEFSVGQVIAAVCGLVAGAFIAWLLMPLVRKRFSRYVSE